MIVTLTTTVLQWRIYKMTLTKTAQQKPKSI